MNIYPKKGFLAGSSSTTRFGYSIMQFVAPSKSVSLPQPRVPTTITIGSSSGSNTSKLSSKVISLALIAERKKRAYAFGVGSNIMLATNMLKDSSTKC